MIPSCILLIEDEGDREYMTQLYLKYQRLMYSTICKIIEDSWRAEDVFQITLEKLINKVSLLRTLDRDHLVNYIISACKNNAYNELHRSARQQMFSFEECYDTSDNENGTRSVEEWVIQQDSFKRLMQVWPNLDTRSQYLLEARYILGQSTKEIAEELHIKPDSVRMALTRARKNVYSLIENNIS